MPDTAALFAALPAICSTDSFRPHLRSPFTVTIAKQRRSVGTDGVMALVVDGGSFESPPSDLARELSSILLSFKKVSRVAVRLDELRAWAGDNDSTQLTCPKCNGRTTIPCTNCRGTGRRLCDVCGGDRRHACADCNEMHRCGHCDFTGHIACDCKDGKQDCDCTDGKVDPPVRYGRIAGLLIDRRRLAALLANVTGDQVHVAATGALGVFGDGWTALLMRMVDDGEKCPTWGEVAS